MAGRARHGSESGADSTSVVAAYAGSARGAGALAPAIEALRRACPRAPIWLLWPAEIACPESIDDLAQGRIDYALPDSAGNGLASMTTRPCGRVPERIAATGAGLALVFTDDDVEPYAAAYLCYLAGVERRAGFSREFAGRVLSDVFPPPGAEGPARHLELLRMAGLEAGTGQTRNEEGLRGHGPCVC